MDAGLDDFDERFSDPDSTDEDAWEEADADVDNVKTACLFCDEMFGTPETLLAHCTAVHSFDLIAFAKGLNLDCFGFIQLVNFVRHTKPTPDQLREICSSADAQVPPPWKSETYLQPVVPNDVLLQYFYDNEAATTEAQMEDMCDGAGGLRNLQLENRYRLHEQDIIIQQLQQTVEELRSKIRDGLFAKAASPLPAAITGDDESYFESYDHYGIHASMLKDKIRTEAYQKAILENPKVFAGKLVLDVGCGTGILSLFAATAGAKRVTAVDYSDIAFSAMDVVRENNLDKVITVQHKRVEDVILDEKADVIISEWMGYCLLFECMLESILYARDHLLKPDGLVFPNRHCLYLCASSDSSLLSAHVAFWDNVYGYKMSTMKQHVVREAHTINVDPKLIVTDSALIKELNLNDRSLGLEGAIDFTSSWTLVSSGGKIVALVVYFDTKFDEGCDVKVQFSTGPNSPETHWKQTVFLLPKPVETTAGQQLTGQFHLRKNIKDPRSLSVDILLEGQKLHYVVA